MWDFFSFGLKVFLSAFEGFFWGGVVLVWFVGVLWVFFRYLAFILRFWQGLFCFILGGG